ncbi:related to permease of the major facilitator superfamily [Phialocephala subalpina]|uniref:Related to permease of the major facilitator superfamily n=1 Tax=Phialocephala subalpina TaxID=576137 RepID=A0A1L7WKU2_9HELO|nr:related to permease of the major facilitator superfamily [Phialocephala subalpina]
MQSNSEDHSATMSEKGAEKRSLDLTLQQSGIQIGEILSAVTDEEDRKVLRKIDRFILPLMGFCYMLQFMDKVSLGYSTQLGLVKDLGLHGSNYSWASSVFYFGYLGWSWPSSYLSVRFPLGRYLAISVVIWGAILMCHGASTNFTTLIVARFFLGVSEAAVAPGFSLLTGMFYKRREQPSRMGVWFAGNGVANIFSGVIAYGIGKISSRLATWRILFLILGGITVAYGIVLLLLLPDSPKQAKFLNPKERAMVLQRTLENRTGVLDEGKFKICQMWEAFRDPQAWLLALYTLSVNIPNGGVTSFNSLIVAGFGFSRLNTLLVQMPSGAIQLIALAIMCIIATYVKNSRLVLMISAVSISLIGMVLVYAIPNTSPYGRLAGIWLCSPFAANIPLSLSLITSNVGGLTKKATVSAMLFVAYSAGNIIGPQFFYAREAPGYSTGIRATLSGFALGIFFLVLLLAYYIWKNKRRDRVFGNTAEVSAAQDLAEDLSNKTDMQLQNFRYAL